MSKAYKVERGFTLIELAIVLVIIGVLMAGFIGTLTNRIENTRIQETEKELDEIKQALLAYAFTQAVLPRLPCPDTDVPPDGIENRPAGCAADTGILPWLTLGIGHADAWNTRYGYFVNTTYADTGFDLTATGLPAQVQTRLNDVVTNLTGNGAAVIFSYGKNGLGGVSSDNINRPAVPAAHVDETANINGDRVFISRFRTDEGVTAAGGAFDDILIWISEYEIKAKMVEAGALP